MYLLTKLELSNKKTKRLLSKKKNMEDFKFLTSKYLIALKIPVYSGNGVSRKIIR